MRFSTVQQDDACHAGALDLALYDRKAAAGVRPLPLVKLVDNFDAQYSYVANEGPLMTFQTNLHAPRYRQALILPLACSLQSWRPAILNAMLALKKQITRVYACTFGSSTCACLLTAEIPSIFMIPNDM